MKIKNINKLRVLCPTYFTLPNNCKNLNISIDKRYAIRTKNGFKIPDGFWENIDQDEAIWITNPIYCTGVSYQSDDVLKIEIQAQNGTIIIADECLARKGLELSRQLSSSSNFLGIYAPHKGVCVNGYKFSLFSFPIEDQEVMDMWSDPIYGCLSASNVIAVQHYLEPNFDEYAYAVEQKVSEARKFVIHELKQFSYAESDLESTGYLISIYFPSLDGALAQDNDLIWEIMKSSAGSFIPGVRNHFSEEIGFCFRINLTRDCPQFRGTLKRIISILGALSNRKELAISSVTTR